MTSWYFLHICLYAVSAECRPKKICRLLTLPPPRPILTSADTHSIYTPSSSIPLLTKWQSQTDFTTIGGYVMLLRRPWGRVIGQRCAEWCWARIMLLSTRCNFNCSINKPISIAEDSETVGWASIIWNMVILTASLLPHLVRSTSAHSTKPNCRQLKILIRDSVGIIKKWQVTLWPYWVSRGSSKWYPAVYKYTATSNIERENPRIWTYNRQASRWLDVAASPCHVGDSRYSSIQSTLLNHTSFTFIPTCISAHRRPAFRDIYGQSINSVHFTFPFHGRVYRH